MARGESTLPPVPNYSFNPGANVPTGPAEVVARQQEQQMQQNQQSQESILRTTQMASQLVQSFVEMSKQRQQRDAIKAYVSFNPNSGDQATQRQLLAKVMATNPNIAAEGISRQVFPTTLQGVAALGLTSGIGMNPQLPETAAALQKPLMPKIIQGQGNDGQLHNFRVDPKTNQKTDLGLAKQPTPQVGKIFQGQSDDGQTHNFRLEADGTKTDLGLTANKDKQKVSAQAQGTADFAKTMLPHIDEMRNIVHEAAQQGFIGPGAGRIYGQFLAGKVGSTGNDQADQLLGKLRAVDTLIKSGTLKVHFGSRGGQQMYQHFSDVLNSGKQSEAEINGALDGIKSFLNGYANMGQPTSAGQGQDINALKASVRAKLGL